VSNTELFRRLAQEMEFEDPWFRRSDEEMIQDALDWDLPAVEGITIANLRKKGFARLNVDTPERRTPHVNGEFLTPSGKCEFKSSLAASGSFVLPNFRQGYRADQTGTPVAGVPDYIPPREAPPDHAEEKVIYPLRLITPKAHAFLNSGYANMPAQRHVAGERCATLHPDDALSRGIRDGAIVTVFNDRGRVSCKAKLSTDVMRGVVAVHAGHWRTGSRGNAAVNALASSEFSNIGRAPTFNDIAVEVAPS
jgi:anaerobic selenocysteine-containing dehydrogenase